MCSTNAFGRVKGVGALAQKMIETKKHEAYPFVYLLIALALILPVATATVDKVFFCNEYHKGSSTQLHKRIMDE